MRLEYFPKVEIRLRRLLIVYRRTSRLFNAVLLPWMDDIKPDFLGIGAPRAASTWFHKSLDRHPQLYLPHEKELHFFDLRKRSGDGYRYNLGSALHRRWYSLCFKAGRNLLKGEITPDYSILSVSRIREIADYMPNVKVVYILRNPVDRAWSGMRRIIWYDKGAKAGNCDVADLMRLTKDSGVLIRGNYRRNIETWESVISAAHIHYIFFDDIKVDGRKELERTCDFLCVDKKLLPDAPVTAKPVNFAPESKMPEAVRYELIQYYKKDQDFLEKKFGRDLKYWYAY